MIHTVKGFGIVNKAEIDVFLEFPYFFYDPENVGNLISGSSAFSKSSLYIWKFTVHVLLKPGLENPRDGGAWWAAVSEVAQSRTRLKRLSSSSSSNAAGTSDQIANIHWIIKKAREFQKNIYFCFIDYAKPLTVLITINCGKF